MHREGAPGRNLECCTCRIRVEEKLTTQTEKDWPERWGQQAPSRRRPGKAADV